MERLSAVVTGAAQGIGLAITRALITDGWFVVGVDRAEQEAEHLAKELGSGGLVVGMSRSTMY
jgi:NAD(P)-dependent dehydrogenase (short-subunit alcohol dehydrogenase family)